MSLTQERINEIALECWAYAENSILRFAHLFLSRIREEQEAVAEVKEGHLANWLQWKSEELMSIVPIGTQLFTIPPVAPDCDCKELVEALEKVVNLAQTCIENITDDEQAVIDASNEALAKHNASMEEK